MASTHTRNVTGMHKARRCEALTARGVRCGAPALSGKKRCHKHGGKGSKGRSYADRFGDYSKANLERDRQTRLEVKKLDRLTRRFESEEALEKYIPAALEIRQGLMRTTQLKRADLAAAYIPEEPDIHGGDSYVYRPGASSLSNPRATNPEAIRDRARGAMLGLAIGEAIGLTLEGRERDSYRPVAGILGGGILGLAPGQWGPATAMALSLLESLLWRRRLDRTDLLDRFVEWEEEGVNSCTGECTGIDEITREALREYRAREEVVAGFAHAGAYGTGSVARLAPVAIRYWNNRDALRAAAAGQSETTHSSHYAVEGCIALAEVLANAIDGSSRNWVLGGFDTSHIPSMETVMWGSWNKKQRDDICSDDDVLLALEAAMWCVSRTSNFEDAVLRCANLGGAAGNLTAITGQVAGAFYGARAIPREWLKQLAWRTRIEERTDRLFDQSLEPERDEE